MEPVRARSLAGQPASQVVSFQPRSLLPHQTHETGELKLMETLATAFNNRRTAYDEQIKMFIGAIMQTKANETQLELQRLKTQEAQAMLQREAIAAFNLTAGQQQPPKRSSSHRRTSRSPSPKRSRYH